MKDYFKTIYMFLANRLFILFIVVCAMFWYLCSGIFKLQIVSGVIYQPQTRAGKTNTLTIGAPRGEIYDRYGRPLAVNETAFTVKFDTSIRMSVNEMGSVMAEFVKLMNKRGENILDDLPISKDKPYVFEFSSETRERQWKKDMDADEELTAEECYEHLLKYFKVPEGLTEQEQRQTLAMCAAIYMERYNMNPVTASMGIKPETMAEIEEKNQSFPGVYIDRDYLRVYPEGEYMAHIIGYIRKISAEELSTHKSLGYTSSDLFGKDGIERAFELQLKGEKGETKVELDQSGRLVNTVREKDPVAGDKVFLTIDSELQKFTVDTVEDMLSEILINKMLGKSAREKPLTAQDVICGLISTNNISVDKIMLAEEGSISFLVKKYLLENSALDPEGKNYLSRLKSYLTDTVNANKIHSNRMIGVMAEQGLVTLTENEAALIERNRLSSISFLVSKVQSGVLTPQMLNLNPSTASVIVLDIKNGDVLAAANYPNYDNNRFVNNFDIDYFQKLNNDPTLPMINRVFSSPRPPGSTFKMITALAGLQNGIITPMTRITDGATFTKAGWPYASCHIAPGSHGSINVSQALEESCNYFFYETSYQMGNTKDGTKLEGIAALNEYMIKFGLNSYTGVEISELAPNISSPERKEQVETFGAQQRGEKAMPSQLQWQDGDTIRTAIGQSLNAYTAAAMGKYIATLANGGTRYSLHLMDKILSADGTLITEYQPVIEEVIDIRPANLDAVLKGMALVTQGSRGTAASVFRDFPMKVGGKTGTTQQGTDGSDHASFACFAPFDDPQIAVYVVIPYGNSAATSSPAPYIAKSIIARYFGLDGDENVAREYPIMDNSLAY